MRYWEPFTGKVIQEILKDKITNLIIVPLYPQYSISTTGSSLRVLEEAFKQNPALKDIRKVTIESWFNQEEYIKAQASLIEKTLQEKYDDQNRPHIFFSAHGVPESYITQDGDLYKQQMEDCVRFIMNDLKASGFSNDHTLAYQSRVGPVQWLKPYTDDEIPKLAKDGVKDLCVVPISFVSDHIETLEEIDQEYRELAEENGITGWSRVPALNIDPKFINALADMIIDKLP